MVGGNNESKYAPIREQICAGMISDLTTTLELQGVPGWPEIYGLGCCEYRLNATHSAWPGRLALALIEESFFESIITGRKQALT